MVRVGKGLEGRWLEILKHRRRQNLFVIQGEDVYI